MSANFIMTEQCPLCMELLDATERAISFCSCGFNICRFCWKKLLESENGRCPHCRELYDEKKVTLKSQQLIEETPEDLSNKNRPKKKKSDKRRGTKIDGQERKNLQELRILQRNLVYAVGLSLDICVEKVLSQNEFFGQFGAIKKISVNRSSPYSSGQSRNGPTGAAYVTFKRNEDAAVCVNAIDGAVWDGHYIRACFGTTKYCQAFLKGAQCNNPDCLYMHHRVTEGTFTKEEMNSGGVKGQPELYSLINFDRSKGPVPGSLAKPPKGPGTGPRRDSIVQERPKGVQDLDWPQAASKTRGSCELMAEKGSFDLDSAERNPLVNRKSSDVLWSHNSAKSQTGLNFSTASLPLQVSSKKSLTLSSPVKVKMVTNNRSSSGGRSTAIEPSNTLVPKLSVESALSLQSEDRSPSSGRYLHPHDGERLRETKSATPTVEDLIRDKESIQNMIRRRTSVPEHLVEETKGPLMSTSSRRGPPPGFEGNKSRYSGSLDPVQKDVNLQSRASVETARVDAIKTLTKNMMEPTKNIDFTTSLVPSGAQTASMDCTLTSQQFVGNLQSPFVTNTAGSMLQQSAGNLGFSMSGYNAGDMTNNSLLQSLISSSTGLGILPALHDTNSQQLSNQGSVPLMQNRLSADAIDMDVLAIQGLSSQGVKNPNSGVDSVEEHAEAIRTMLQIQDNQRKMNFGQDSNSNPFNDPAVLAFKKSADPELIKMSLQKNNLLAINEQNNSGSTNTMSPFDCSGIWGTDPTMPMTPFLMTDSLPNVPLGAHQQWMEAAGSKMQNPSGLGGLPQNGHGSLQMMESSNQNNSFLYSDQVSSTHMTI
eukprot:g4981.t1